MRQMTAQEIDTLLTTQDYYGIVAFASRQGILQQTIFSGLQLQPPEFLSTKDFQALGRLYAYLLDNAEKRLGVQEGRRTEEEIQKFSEIRVQEEVAIANRIFTWPEKPHAQFMYGVQVSSQAYRDLCFTKASLQKDWFKAKKN